MRYQPIPSPSSNRVRKEDSAPFEAEGYRPPTIAKMLKSVGIFVSRRGVATFYQEYTQLTCLLLLGLK